MAALLLALPTGVRAEEPSQYETVVRGRAVDEERPADDPAGFSTVLRIKAPPAGTGLPQLVERVPGLRVRDSGPGGRKTLNLRGSGGHQAVVVLDGIRLSSGAGQGVDLSLLDPAHLERAEVRRGGGSARFGSAALGGVLVLSTPRMRSRSRSRASVGYGSWNTLAASASRSGAIARRLRYLASGSFRRSDGDFAYEHHLNHTPHVRANNDSQQGELLLKLDYLASDRWRVGALNDLALGERGAPGILDSPCSMARQGDLRNLAALKASRYDLLQQGSRLDLTAHHRFGSFRFRDPCAFNRASHTNGHDFGAAARWLLPMGKSGQLNAGVELREELLQDRLPANQRTLASSSVDRFNADLFISSKIRLLGGAIVGVPAVRLAAAGGHGATVVPKAGLVVRPLLWTANSWLTPLAVAGNIGRAFRYPSFHELYVDMDSLRGNPDLQPEDAVEGDLGLRWSREVASAEVAYFRRKIKNQILYAPVSPYLVEARNYDGVLTDGLEGSVRLRPGWGLRLEAAYTFTRSAWGEPALRLPGHPEHRLVTRIGWDYPHDQESNPAWTVRLWTGLTYESGMPLDQHNNVLLGPRVLLSAGGAGTWRWLTLSAEGRNLLDQRALLDNLGFPLPPARFLVSLSAAI